jgi:hypothetical protein
MPSSAWAGWIYFESTVEVEAAKGVRYRLPMLRAASCDMRCIPAVEEEDYDVMSLSTASTKFSISGTRRASSLPYFSLGLTIGPCFAQHMCWSDWWPMRIFHSSLSLFWLDFWVLFLFSPANNQYGSDYWLFKSSTLFNHPGSVLVCSVEYCKYINKNDQTKIHNSHYHCQRPIPPTISSIF